MNVKNTNLERSMKSGAIHIREATFDDAAQLHILLQQLGYNINLETVKIRITAYQNTQHKIFVAIEEGNIVGEISLGIYEQLWIDGPSCRIDTIVIDQSHRGHGIGKQLIEYAEQYALKVGCKVIELITSDKRRASGTHAFYESLGYKDHVKMGYSYFCKEYRFDE